MNNRELTAHCKHIVSYGPKGWGLGLLRRMLKDQEIYVKNNLEQMKEAKTKIIALKKAIEIAKND